MVNQTKNQVGEAYAFFDVNAPIEEVHQEIADLTSFLLEDAKSKLELSLSNMADFRRTSNDMDLLQVLDSAPFYPVFHSEARKLKEQVAEVKTPMRMKDLRYALTARYSNGTNEDAGNALCTIMEGIYSMYSAKMLFMGDIVGKAEDGKYYGWKNPE